MSTTTDANERNDESIEAIKAHLCPIIAKRLKANEVVGPLFHNRKLRTDALKKLSPQSIDAGVTYHPLFDDNGIPHISLYIKPQPGDEHGTILQMGGIEDYQAIFEGLSDADFYQLCVYGAERAVRYYDDTLKHSDAKHLASNYNGVYNYKQLYQLQKGWCDQALEWVKKTPMKEVREKIGYF